MKIRTTKYLFPIFCGIMLFFISYSAHAKNELVTSHVSIIFDDNDGLPLYYHLVGVKEPIRGKSEISKGLKVIVRDKVTRTDTTLTAQFKGFTEDHHSGFASYDILYNGEEVSSFTLKYAVDKTVVTVSLENVEEYKHYLLLEVQPTSLVTYRNRKGIEWLAHGDASGVYSTIKDAKPCVLGDKWSNDFPDFPNFTYLPLVMMGNTQANCSMEVLGYVCSVALSVDGKKTEKQATMGVKGHYRIRGGHTTPDILVEQKELCRLDFTQDYDNNKQVDWLDAAKSVRDRMPEIPTHYFDDKFAWIISGQAGRAPEISITFPNIINVIKKINHLTDGCPQELYISGWTEGGHDTGYPNVTILNQRMGGINGYLDLKENAASYNTNVSFDDMYEDHYDNEYSKGFYDEKYIARTREGDLMTFRAWNEVDTCRLAGVAKYMEEGGPGMKRIQYMLNNYRLKNSLLIDGMSWWSIRHDWDPKQPASAVKNLRAKYKIIDEYKKNGIHIISELLRYPFVGKMAYVVDGPQDAGWGWNGFGGDIIPLMRLVYSKSIIYGGNGGDGLFRDPRQVLFNNNRRGPWISEKTPNTEITDYYYINFILWEKLHALDLIAYNKKGDVVDISLENNWNIHIDYSKPDGYTVTHNGVTVLDGPQVTCPIENNRIAFYSKTEKILSYPLPVNNPAPTVYKVKVLSENGSAPYPFEVKEGKIEIAVPANTPVILSY